MPTWTFEQEMRTDDQRRRAHAFLAALREDPNVAHIECHDDNPLNPHVMRVEVSCADGINNRTVEILRTLDAVGVPADSLFSAASQAQLLSRGYLSLNAPLQVSQIDIRDIRPQGRSMEDFARERAEVQRLDREARQQIRAAHPSQHNDMVDAFATALYGIDRVPGAQVEHAGFTRQPLTGFSRLQIPDPEFRQEYQGTFRVEEPEGDMVINPRALQRLTQDNAIIREQDLRAYESMDRQAWVDRARREIQEDVDRDILDTLARQDDVRRHLEAARPPEPPKPKVPEPIPRTRFERIDDD